MKPQGGSPTVPIVLGALVLVAGLWIPGAGLESDGLPLSTGGPEATSPVAPDTTDPIELAALRRLQGDVLASIRAAGWPSSEWGVVAVSLESGDTLVSLNADVPMIPASNQKLLTSAAALELLGPSFRFPTFLIASGPVVDGVLEGDLVLLGTGDPSLEARDPSRPEGAFAHFLEALQAVGIDEVRGDVVGDGRFFSGEPRQSSWNPLDLNNWYAAPVSGLSINENMVTLRVVAGSVSGAPPRILTVPEGAGIPVVNRGRTVDQRPSPSLLMVRDDPDDPIEIRGQIHRDGGDVWRSLTVSDPPAYAASLLSETLRHAGVRIQGRARAASASDPDFVSSRFLAAPASPAGHTSSRTLAVHRSPPLPELLEIVNKRSHNLFAEQLFVSLGRHETGEGSFDGGVAALTGYLTEHVGLDRASFDLVDGSGLSRRNRITPAGIVRALSHMNASSTAEAYWASLPEAGNRRELNRMHRSPAANNLRAKTGTIDRTSALSGLVRNGSGESVLFSIIANNVPSSWSAKRIEDRIGIHLAAFDRPVLAPDLAPVRNAPARSEASPDVPPPGH